MDGVMIAGVDEAGRGPLAGPVVAAAVILKPNHNIVDIKDSKLLNALKREKLYHAIINHSICYAIGFADEREIDQINILQATLLAMKRAVDGLTIAPTEVWVDGRDKPKVAYPVQAIIDGDALVEVIGAASILAKVTRDNHMQMLDKQFPGYGFSEHKGYATRQHLDALKRLGPCAIHRRSFRPVSEVESLAIIRDNE